MTTIMDPTNESVPVTRSITPRPAAITGNVAFLDISKPRGNVLIDRLEELLAERLPEVTFKRYAKPTFTKPAPDALRKQIQA
ncbi:MAG: UGSC family (seleno)protein, partial [Pseudomonadota bacterium]